MRRRLKATATGLEKAEGSQMETGPRRVNTEGRKRTKIRRDGGRSAALGRKQPKKSSKEATNCGPRVAKRKTKIFKGEEAQQRRWRGRGES